MARMARIQQTGSSMTSMVIYDMVSQLLSFLCKCSSCFWFKSKMSKRERKNESRRRTHNFFRWFYLFNSVAYSLISIIGVVGNVAVFIVVTKSAQMRTLTNKFIGNLAVADLLVNVVCVPFTLVSNLFPGKFFSSYFELKK